MDTIEALQKIGFTLYEAKVYKALISNPNSTGYELSKHSQVPRGKVYEVLESLVEKGAALIINKTEKQIYQPLPYELLLSRHKDEVNEVISKLNTEFQKLENLKEEEPFINLNNHNQIFLRAEEMCNEAKNSILVTGFQNELLSMKEHFQAAEKRGITVFALEFGDCDLGLDKQFFHYISPLQEKQIYLYGRWFAIVKDTNECLLAQVKQNSTTGVWTKNMAMVLAITMWLQHDIMVHVMEKEVDEKIVNQISKKANITLNELWSLGAKGEL
jgi:sugar-specific transcriptional regulator TrmB